MRYSCELTRIIIYHHFGRDAGMSKGSIPAGNEKWEFGEGSPHIYPEVGVSFEIDHLDMRYSRKNLRSIT